MIRYTRTLLCLLVLSISTFSYAQESHFTLDDMNRLTTISNLQISPDGKAALFTTSKRNMETNSFDRSIILLDIATGQQRVLSDEIPGIGSVTWAPDGRNLSVIARGTNAAQVHLLNLETKKLTQITSSKNGIVRYSWSPDGTKLAYFMRDDRAKNPNGNLFNDAFEAGNNDYLVDEAPRTTSVWIINRDGTETQQVSLPNTTVATGLSTSSLAWSPNSKMIAFTQFPSAYSGDSDRGKNYIFDLESRDTKPATVNKERESGALFSPDGNHLVYRYPRDGFPSNMTEWHQVNLETGQISNITKPLNRSTSDINWLPDGSTLHRGIDNWGNMLFHLNDGNYNKLPVGDLASITSLSISDAGPMVLTGVKKTYPVEVYYKANMNAEPVALTSFNSFIEDLTMGEQEGLEWKSSDGLEPNGIITYPPNFDPNKKYPLVLQIHGGPSASSVFGFSATTQAMASKGWIIFQPNYRGSTNLGNEFQTAIARDPSEGPGHDVITGVDELKKRPYVDSDNISVSGWSYGGWMTSWLIGRYPDVWKSAVAGAAPVDLTDMYSLNDLNRMKRHSMIESPYTEDNIEWAFKNSPISNFGKITAPTLIMSKTGDTRVTITGSYKLHGALRDNGVPVQFIAYPGRGHFPRDPVRSHDVYNRWLNWIEQHTSIQNETDKATLRR